MTVIMIVMGSIFAAWGVALAAGIFDLIPLPIGRACARAGMRTFSAVRRK